MPEQLANNAITVDISIYIQQYTRDQLFEWKLHKLLIQNTSNDGQEMVTIPSSSVSCNYPRQLANVKGLSVCPAAIKVSLRGSSLSLPSSIGLWSGIAFLTSSFTTVKELRSQCDAWSSNEVSTTSARLRQLRPCPPNKLVANFDVELEMESRSSSMNPDSDYEKEYMKYFHLSIPSIDVCYRQNV